MKYNNFARCFLRGGDGDVVIYERTFCSRSMVIGQVEFGEGIDDAHGFDADMDDPLDGGYQILRVFEPGIGIVEDAALFVLRNPVTVDEPPQRCFPVDLVLMRSGGNAL